MSGAEARTQGNLSPGDQGPWTRQAGKLSHRDVSLPYKSWRHPGAFQATPIPLARANFLSVPGRTILGLGDGAGGRWRVLGSLCLLLSGVLSRVV